MVVLRLIVVSILALSLFSCQDEGTQEIIDVFDAYNAAFDHKKGETYLELIDDKYIAEVDRVLNAARTYGHEKVFRMRPWERWWIVVMRNRLSKQELASLDGRSFLKLMVDRGWDLDELSGPMIYSLGTITFKKPRATAELVIDGERTGLRYEFVQINHQWKIDPMCEEEWCDRLIEKLARASGLREDTWIKGFESAGTGKRVGEDIWDPPK